MTQARGWGGGGRAGLCPGSCPGHGADESGPPARTQGHWEVAHTCTHSVSQALHGCDRHVTDSWKVGRSTLPLSFSTWSAGPITKHYTKRYVMRKSSHQTRGRRESRTHGTRWLQRCTLMILFPPTRHHLSKLLPFPNHAIKLWMFVN